MASPPSTRIMVPLTQENSGRHREWRDWATSSGVVRRWKGYYLPKTEISNDFLHKEVGLERGPDWVDSRLGIYKRYTVLSLDYIVKTKNQLPTLAMLHARSNCETPVTMGAKAARQALKQAGIKPEQVG